MPRPSLDDVIARVPTGFPPVAYKPIRRYWERWAAEMFRDTFAATLPAYSVLSLDSADTVVVGDTFATFTDWNAQANTEDDLMEAIYGTGLITCKAQMIVSFGVIMNAVLANNVLLTVRVAASEGGVEIYQASSMGSGSGSASNFAFGGIFSISAPPQTVSVQVESPGGAVIDFESCSLIASYSPYVTLTRASA